MGRGDKKTKRGKIFKGSFGNSRKRKRVAAYKPTAAKTEKVVVEEVDVAKAKPAKKATKKKAAKKTTRKTKKKE